MRLTNVVPVDKLTPLNLRPVLQPRVELLKASIKQRGYDPACPLVVQPNGKGYLVVNGCHRLQAVQELGLREVPVVEYPADEDPVRLALRTQENDEGVQPWDFLDRAFLVKQLYEELGTQEKVAEKLRWTQQNVSHYLKIAELPEAITTEIRNSVVSSTQDTVVLDHNGRCRKNLDDLWKPTWFRHICALPTDELRLAVVRKIAENPSRWKEKDVAAECSRLKRRHELSLRVGEILGSQEGCEQELAELLAAVEKGLYDSQPEKAVERAEAVLISSCASWRSSCRDITSFRWCLV